MSKTETFKKKCGCSLRDLFNFRNEWSGIEQVWCAEHANLSPNLLAKLRSRKLLTPKREG